MLFRVLKDVAAAVFAPRADGAAKLAPSEAQMLYDTALACHARGETGPALEYCERALRLDPLLAEASDLKAQIILGGERYTKVLERIFEQLRPRTYVEIGVSQGGTLQLARPPTIAIGIDPEPMLKRPLAANHRIFAETSDAFFAGHDLGAELGGVPVDLAFIDGMHHFEFALRDFINLERACSRESTILIHDCYPLDRVSAERTRHGLFWSGDIWRLIVLLKKHRPDLSVHTIGAPPTGLAVVRRLDPGSRVLQENYGRLCEEALALDYAILDEEKPRKLNLFPNDPGKIRTLLGGG